MFAVTMLAAASIRTAHARRGASARTPSRLTASGTRCSISLFSSRGTAAFGINVIVAAALALRSQPLNVVALIPRSLQYTTCV